MNKNQNIFPDVCSLLVRPTMFQIAFCSELNPSLSILQILILVSLNRFRPPRFLQCAGLDKTHRGLLPQQYQQITSSIIKNHQTSKKNQRKTSSKIIQCSIVFFSSIHMFFCSSASILRSRQQPAALLFRLLFVGLGLDKGCLARGKAVSRSEESLHYKEPVNTIVTTISYNRS